MAQALNAMVAHGTIGQWWETIYEPETYALGGPTGIDIAHRLFHADSRELLTHIGLQSSGAPDRPRLGRKELSILLISSLMRGAGQEWAEQGDIWHRVERSRPLPSDTPSDRLRAMAPDLLKLLSLDVGPASSLLESGAPLAELAQWLNAFDNTGKQLGEAASTGQLKRGIRDVLERHVLFHWNRLGLPQPQQSIVARVARSTIFSE